MSTPCKWTNYMILYLTLWLIPALNVQAWNLAIIVMPYLTFTTCAINMAALLTAYTNEEQCAAIQFLWAECVRGPVHQTSAQYDDRVLLQWSVYERMDMVKTAKQVSLTENDKGNHLHLLKGTHEDRWVANQLQISDHSACEIIHHRLHFHNVCAKWVPKQLTEQCWHNVWTSDTAFWTSIIGSMTPSWVTL
jgi:hypothetical protein